MVDMPEAMQAVERELTLFALTVKPGVGGVVMHRAAVPGGE